MSNISADEWDPVADLTPVEIAETTSSDKPALVFLCRFPGCGRQFQLKGNLKRHQNIHSGDKQFRCDLCGRSFLRKADMEVHLRVHTGEKPYACQHAGCDKRFARRSDLLSHERTHSGSKPFACEFPGCGRRFARRFDLHKHERSHDGDSAATTKKPTMKRRLVVRVPTPCCSRAHGDDEQDDDDDTTTQGDEDDGSLVDAGESVKQELQPQQQQQRPRSKRTIATSATAARGASATASTARGALRGAPISPTDHANGPGKDFHFELTCTEEHIHTAPDCFSIEEWDALLGTTTPGTACCPEHLQNIAEAFATAHAHAHVYDSFHQSMGGVVDSYLHPHAGGRIPCYSPAEPVDSYPQPPPPQPFPLSLHPSPSSPTPHPLPPTSLPTTPVPSPSPSRIATDAMTVQLSATSLSSPCPVAAEAKLHDHAAHTSCGHLSIQHGDHRDFVVKNHLVCVDNVRSLTGDCGGAHASAYGKSKPLVAPPHPSAAKCAPQDPHRPGCGHLAVRHGDHIDYVVEDNLFCQLAGGLMEDAGNVELLDDDFWEFYGAIGSLKTE